MVSSGSSNSLAMASTVPGEAGPIGRWGGCIIPGAPPAGCGGGTLGKLKRYKQSSIITHNLDLSWFDFKTVFSCSGALDGNVK